MIILFAGGCAGMFVLSLVYRDWHAAVHFGEAALLAVWLDDYLDSANRRR
jgi:hypothetical protein